MNACLAELLGEVLGGARVVPGRAGRFDLKIDYRGVEFVVEASYDRRDAVEDARRRVEGGPMWTAAVALHYDPKALSPAETPGEIKEILSGADLELKVFSQGSDVSGPLLKYMSGGVRPAGGWLAARVEEFPRLLDSTVELLVREDPTASLIEEIGGKTDAFIGHAAEAIGREPKLGESLERDLYLTLFSPSREGEDAVVPDVPREVVLAHAYISLLMASVLYESVGPRRGLDPLQKLLSVKKGHPLLAMKEAFSGALEVNYEPVFDVAVAVVDALFALQRDLTVIQDLRELIELAQAIADNRAVLRRDFIGRVYHRVTGDVATRKGYATFYTKAPIAHFLAFLALLSPNESWRHDWADLETLRGKFRICDFACGSGTLLSASYAALQSLHRSACLERGGSPDPAGFHRAALEECIWGFDALEHAAQTASVVLSLHEPGVPLGRIRVYHVPVDGSGSLGSLNFWWGRRQLVPIERRGVEEVSAEEVELPGFDLVIMNPPFARATAPGRAGSRPRIFDFAPSPEAFERLWQAYARLVRDVEREVRGREAIRRIYGELVGEDRAFVRRSVDPLYAGASLPFFFLADRYLRPGGRVALVLPRTALEGSSFLLLRAALISDYDLEYVVISSEPGGSNFSYSTQFSEALVVARKVGSSGRRSPLTYFINFRRQPGDVLSGVLMAREVLGRLPPPGGREVVRVSSAEAEVYAVERERVADLAWSLAPLLTPPATRGVLGAMIEGRLPWIGVRLRRLGEFPGIRVTNPRRFRGREFGSMYSRSPSGGLRLLSRTGREVLSSLELDPSKTVGIVPKTPEASEFYAKVSGRLLVPEAVRFNATPLVAAWSPEAVASSRAHMLRAEDPAVERALCAWMNSSLAVAWLRTLSTTLEGEFGHVYGWHLRTLPVPDLGDPTVVGGLDSVFRRYARETWPPLPAQYPVGGGGAVPLRLGYDLEVLRALSAAGGAGFDEGEVRAGLRALYSELSESLRGRGPA